MDPVPGNEMKDESAQDLNTLGFEPGTQWSLSLVFLPTQPSAPR